MSSNTPAPPSPPQTSPSANESPGDSGRSPRKRHAEPEGLNESARPARRRRSSSMQGPSESARESDSATPNTNSDEPELSIAELRAAYGEAQARPQQGPAPANAGQRWTNERNVSLIQMRKRNVPYNEIGKQLGKTALACRLHHHNLMKAKKHEQAAQRQAYFQQQAMASGGPVIGSSAHYGHVFGSHPAAVPPPFDYNRSSYYGAQSSYRHAEYQRSAQQYRPILPAERSSSAGQNTQQTQPGRPGAYPQPNPPTFNNPQEFARQVASLVDQYGTGFWPQIGEQLDMPASVVERAYYQYVDDRAAAQQAQPVQSQYVQYSNASTLPPVAAPSQNEHDAASALWNMSSASLGSTGTYPGDGARDNTSHARHNSGAFSPRTAPATVASSSGVSRSSPVQNGGAPMQQQASQPTTETVARPSQFEGPSLATQPQPTATDRAKDARQDSTVQRMSVANVINPPN